MKITIFSKNNCQYCTKAKTLLSKLDLDYEEVKLEDFADTKDFLKEIGKQVRTMPQIKIDGELVGGYHQLVEFFDDKGLVNFKGEKVERRQER
tara:strand:- start:273 stop:551 length:279 start_codon:yes stop_codon:yes gene_type:complete